VSDSTEGVKSGRLSSRWALRYDFCRKCGKNDHKHMARGLCSKCYAKEQEERARGHRPMGHTLDDRVTELTPRSGIDLDDYLRYEYIKKKRSMIDIAKELGCTRQAVYKALKKFGIRTRSQSEAADLALRRGKKRVTRMDESGHEFVTTLNRLDVNEEFFSNWSPGMAYVLGLVYTDGSVDPGWKLDPQRRSRAKPTLRLTQKEPELLQKALVLMDCNQKLRHTKERHYGSIVAGAIHYFEISNEKMYHDLLTLGVTPNKSLTLSFPEMPDRHLIRHFVRGCWDGDGTVYVPPDGKSAGAYAGIVSGSEQFMIGLVEHLYHLGIKRFSGRCDEPIRIYRNRNAYDIRIKGRTNLITLFHCLYDDVDSSMRLERKYLKFLGIMKLYEALPSFES
jgi:hypothetical protein